MSDKWRSIVDGDIWFFIKAINLKSGGGGGSIGVGPYNSNVKIYFASATFQGVVCITKNQAGELINYIKECNEKAKTIGDMTSWGKEGTFIIRELVTENGVVIHVSSMCDGEVYLKFVIYDSKGEDYYQSALSYTFHMKSPVLDQFIAAVEKAIK